MKYGITKLILGATAFVPITKDEYDLLKSARTFLFEALYLEQKFDIVTENFLEYEMLLLSCAASLMMFANADYARFQNESNNINRKLINLLSACRLYLDHCIHHLSNIYGNQDERLEAVKNQKKAEYDSTKGYRILEALRNYVQHRGFPVQEVRYDRSRIEDGEKWEILFSVTPYIKPEVLREDKKFKSAVLEELMTMGENIDLKELTREFITSIGNVHKKVREILRDDIRQWEAQIYKCIQTFKNEANIHDITGLGVVRREDDGTYSEMTSVFTQFIEHRRHLEQKNMLFGSLTRLYVTSQLIK